MSSPVFAVPTSVGYGAALEGMAALLGMLTSCASGVSVVNIDNGFGAGFLAHRINKLWMENLSKKYQALVANIAKYDNALIAFSGGVDSSLVAFVAGQTLGKKSLAVTSASASLKRADLELSEQLAEAWNIRHRVIVTKELSKREYTSNPTNRCFYCKTSLYEELAIISKNEGFEVTLNGTNVDDLGDYRPGLEAAKNFKVARLSWSADFLKLISDLSPLLLGFRMRRNRRPHVSPADFLTGLKSPSNCYAELRLLKRFSKITDSLSFE